MKKLFLTLLALSVMAAAVGGCSRQPAAPIPTPEGETAPVYVDTPGALMANGTVVPARHLQLSFQVNGQIKDLTVKVGDTVQAGQMLAQLEGRERLEANVTAAELELLNAQQALNSLKAEAAWSVAQAQLETAQAQKKLADDRRVLRYLTSPDITYYQTQVERAQDSLTVAQQGAAMTDLALAAQQAQQVLDDATSVLNDAQVLETRYPGGFTEQVKEAQEAYEVAAQRFYNAQLLLSQSQISQANAVEDAQKKLDEAEANLAGLQQGPEASKLAVAQAQVAASEAALVQAQAYYTRVQSAGIDMEKLAVAEARLKNAQAQLVAARMALTQTTLPAPFAGTVTAVMIQAGQVASVGMPVMELSDTQRWHVETKDIGELVIGKVKIGQPARVTINAFLDAELTGTVVAISPTSIVQLGDTTYTVTVELEPTDLNLRWGMTTKVKILEGE